MIGGDGNGWRADTFYKVRGLAWHGDRLYASVTGPRSDGERGEVWSWNRRAWRREDGEADGPWPASQFVEHLFSHDGWLFAATSGGVWRLRDRRWEDVTGDLAFDDKRGGYAFAAWRGGLAMSFWGEPGVAVFDGQRWQRLAGPSGGWGRGTRTVYCLQSFEDRLYAGTGTGRLTGPAASVWRFDGSSWERIAGGGERGSWSREGIPFVLSLREHAGFLIATLSRPPGTLARTSSAWAFDGRDWRPLGTGPVPPLMARSLIMNDSEVVGGRLIVATGDGQGRVAQVWELEASQRWRPVGGEVFSAERTDGAGGYWIYRLCSASGDLYAGTAGHKGAARVYRFSPSSP